MKRLLILTTLILFSNFIFAQNDDLTNITSEGAAAKMKAGNYEDALTDYLQKRIV
jgi:hypothetical protein